MEIFFCFLVYESLWASWSAWSICVSNRKLRVRACKTVKGFKCLGHNREGRVCSTGKTIVPQPFTFDRLVHHGGSRSLMVNRDSGNGLDYEGLDPWEEDRRIALRQLRVQPSVITIRRIPSRPAETTNSNELLGRQ